MAVKAGSMATAADRSFPPRLGWPARLAWLAFAIYFAYALSHLQVTPARVMAGLEFGYKFLVKLFPPDFQRWELLVKGLK